MICGANARRLRQKNGNHPWRMILDNLVRGAKTETAGADHPVRQSQERSGVMLGTDMDGHQSFGFAHRLEAHRVPSSEDLVLLPLAF